VLCFKFEEEESFNYFCIYFKKPFEVNDFALLLISSSN